MKGKEIKLGLFVLAMAAIVTAPVKNTYAAVSDNTAAYGVQTQADDGTTSGTCGADEGGANATWTLDENGVLTISGTGAIKRNAFGSNASIKEVVIEEGITEIGRYAFQVCEQIEKVTLPESLTTICDNAFLGCSGLKKIKIPQKCETIGEDAFYNCSGLEEILVADGNQVFDSRQDCKALIDSKSNTLLRGGKNSVVPDGVTEIAKSAFAYTGITEITIPDSVIKIGEKAFAACELLKSVVLPANITSIGDDTFRLCSSLETVKLPEGLKTIGNDAFQSSGLQAVTIPNTVDSIEESAFSDCKNLTQITIPQGVTEISPACFWGCENLTLIMLPDSIKKIGYSAFYRCNKLETVLFCGTQAQWEKVSIEAGNSKLSNATVAIQYHDIIKVDETSATCTESGTEAYYKCRICNKMFRTAEVATDPQEISEPVVIPAFGHQFTVKNIAANYLASEATCKEPAHYYYLCEICNEPAKDMKDTYTVGSVKTEHSWDSGKITTEPTTQAEGVKTYTCKICHATKTEAVAKLPAENEKPQTGEQTGTGEQPGTREQPGTGEQPGTEENTGTEEQTGLKKEQKITVKGYTYKVKNASEIIFMGVENKKAKTITIPAKVKLNGKYYKVTELAAKSLKGVQAKTIVIGSQVKVIGKSAMQNCKKLKTLKIKSTKLKKVGKNAFKGVSKKAKVTVPKKMKSTYKKLLKGKGLNW